MAAAVLQNVMQQIRRVVSNHAAIDASDHDLLARFLQDQEEAAFSALVRRHGPMIMGVCLRLLNHREDAEDAFQATFLMLVRKGHTIRQRHALASWLHRVAFRIALRARTCAGRAAPCSVIGDVPVDCDPQTHAAWRELRPVLDAELQRLPAKYRTPMTLCYLEGKTYEEAALQLGCPKGTVAIRLLRGREMLKNRLVRRGLVLSAALIGVQATLPAAQAAVAVSVAKATVAAAALVAQGALPSAVVSGSVVALLHSAARAVWLQGAKVVTALCLGVGLIGTGIGLKITSTNSATVRSEQVAVVAQPGATRTSQAAGTSLESPKSPPALADAQPSSNATFPPPASEIEGTAYVFPKAHHHGGRSTTVVVFRPSRNASGLMMRDRLNDEHPSVCTSTIDERGAPPPSRADNLKTARLRLIVITDRTHVANLPGSTKVIVLAPVSLVEILGENGQIWLR